MSETPRTEAMLREALGSALHDWWNDDHDGHYHSCRPVPSETEFLDAAARHGLTIALAHDRPSGSGLPVHAPTCMGFDGTDGPCAVTGWAAARAALSGSSDPEGWEVDDPYEAIARGHALAAGASDPEAEPEPHDPTWAHTAQNDPAGLYDDNWEPRRDPEAVGLDRLAEAILAARSTTARWKGSARAKKPTQWDRIMAKRILSTLYESEDPG